MEGGDCPEGLVRNGKMKRGLDVVEKSASI
jgi:hypothetical protein